MKKELVITENIANYTNLSNDKLFQITKKIEKINTLKTKNEALAEKLVNIKKIYDANTNECLSDFKEAKKDLIEAYLHRYQQKSYNQTEKDILNEWLIEEFDVLRDLNLVDESIITLSDQLRKIDSAKLNEFEKEMLIDEVKASFNDMGIDFPDDFDYQDFLNNPHDYHEHFEEKKSKRAEEMQHEEIRAKKINTDLDFQKIYKFLVKKIHPDKNISSEDQEKNEEQMKKLTTAWDNRNYYEILLLWLEIDPENTLGIDFTPKNFKSIIKNLNEEIRDLELEDYLLKQKYQDTSFFYQNFNAKTETAITKKIKSFISDIEETTLSTRHRINIVNSSKEFKGLLKYEKERLREEDFFDYEFFANLVKNHRKEYDY